MKYIDCGSMKIPSEFIITKHTTILMCESAHYVVEEDVEDSVFLIVLFYNGVKVNTERLISKIWFLRNPLNYKEFSLEKWHNLKVFL